MSALSTFAAVLGAERRRQIAGEAVADAALHALAGRVPRHSLRVPALTRRAAQRGPAGRIGLELLEARCDRLTRDGRAAAGDITFGGAVLLPDLTTRALGPFQLPRFGRGGEALVFDPPLDLMTFALGPSFAQGCVVLLQARENDGLGGPERVPGLLERVLMEVTAGVRAELRGARGRALPVVEEVFRVAALLREMPAHECLSTVIGSPVLPFADGGATGGAEALTFGRIGPGQTDAYTLRFQFAALEA